MSEAPGAGESPSVEAAAASAPQKDDSECAAGTGKKKAPPTITIINEYCKGCDLCVVACPKDVLAMKSGKVIVVAGELCNGCMLCELRCPDFAILIGEVA